MNISNVVPLLGTFNIQLNFIVSLVYVEIITYVSFGT